MINRDIAGERMDNGRFINGDVLMQVGCYINERKAVASRVQPRVMTWLNIIYDGDHKLFSNLLINYVGSKCNISDFA